MLRKTGILWDRYRIKILIGVFAIALLSWAVELRSKNKAKAMRLLPGIAMAMEENVGNSRIITIPLFILSVIKRFADHSGD